MATANAVPTLSNPPIGSILMIWRMRSSSSAPNVRLKLDRLFFQGKSARVGIGQHLPFRFIKIKLILQENYFDLFIVPFYVEQNSSCYIYIEMLSRIIQQIEIEKLMIKYRQKPAQVNDENAAPGIQIRSKKVIQNGSSTDRPVASKNNSLCITRKNQNQYQVGPEFKINEIIPGVRFGRFFGTIQEATERQIKRRISQKTGELPKQLDVVQQTVRGLSRGRQFSASEKFLMKKIDSLQKKLRKFTETNPKLKQQNQQLKQMNRSMRIQSAQLKNSSDKWEGYNRNKEQELKDSNQKHLLFQAKIVKIHNQTNAPTERQIKIVKIK